jgi:hypothetical protein
VVRCGPVSAIWNVKVSSGGGVAVRGGGVEAIIMLHAFTRGELELSPSLEAKSSSLSDSSRMACSDGDPLWVMPSNIVPRLASFRWLI